LSPDFTEISAAAGNRSLPLPSTKFHGALRSEPGFLSVMNVNSSSLGAMTRS
jgi:hypothetical protein